MSDSEDYNSDSDNGSVDDASVASPLSDSSSGTKRRGGANKLKKVAKKGKAADNSESDVDSADSTDSDSESDDDSDKDRDEDVEIGRIEYESELAPETETVTIRLPDDQRRTGPMMSKMEYTEALSLRIDQISKNSFTMCDPKSVAGMTDPAEMAKKELAEKRSPLILLRKLGPVYDKVEKKMIIYEEAWRISELALPSW